MALFGVRVVADDATAGGGRRAVVRMLAVPLGFLFPGSGFAGILLGDRRRAPHDVIAGTAVICSRDAGGAVAVAVRGLITQPRPALPVLYPGWSGGCPGVASASWTGIRVPSCLTSRTGTLTLRTPLSYRAVTSAASTLAGSLTARASDP